MQQNHIDLPTHPRSMLSKHKMPAKPTYLLHQTCQYLLLYILNIPYTLILHPRYIPVKRKLKTLTLLSNIYLGCTINPNNINKIAHAHSQ